MTTPTFVPPVSPITSLADKPEIKILKADFGDGYTQSSCQLNNMRRVLSLKWDVIDAEESTSILAFFVDQSATKPFFYKVPGETTPMLVTCEEWSSEALAGGVYHAITATFRQSFNAVS